MNNVKKNCTIGGGRLPSDHRTKILSISESLFLGESCREAAKQFLSVKISKYQQKLEPFEIHNIRDPNWKSFTGQKFWAGVKNYGIFLSFINAELYLLNFIL